MERPAGKALVNGREAQLKGKGKATVKPTNDDAGFSGNEQKQKPRPTVRPLGKKTSKSERFEAHLAEDLDHPRRG